MGFLNLLDAERGPEDEKKELRAGFINSLGRWRDFPQGLKPQAHFFVKRGMAEAMP
jgi:hypothetical protein